MIRKTWLAGFLGLVCAAGVTASEIEYSGFHWLKSAAGTQMASGVQWSEQYMVTASHVDFLEKRGISCSTGCDLQFVPVRMDTKTQWREPEILEEVTVMGVTADKGVVKTEGRILALTHKTDPNGMAYQVIHADIEKGMSGGPIYGKDGAVVGMVIGFIDPESIQDKPVLKELGPLGLFMPTSEIRKQWEVLGLTDDYDAMLSRQNGN